MAPTFISVVFISLLAFLHSSSSFLSSARNFFSHFLFPIPHPFFNVFTYETTHRRARNAFHFPVGTEYERNSIGFLHSRSVFGACWNSAPPYIHIICIPYFCHVHFDSFTFLPVLDVLICESDVFFMDFHCKLKENVLNEKKFTISMSASKRDIAVYLDLRTHNNSTSFQSSQQPIFIFQTDFANAGYSCQLIIYSNCIEMVLVFFCIECKVRSRVRSHS